MEPPREDSIMLTLFLLRKELEDYRLLTFFRPFKVGVVTLIAIIPEFRVNLMTLNAT